MLLVDVQLDSHTNTNYTIPITINANYAEHCCFALVRGGGGGGGGIKWPYVKSLTASVSFSFCPAGLSLR